MRCNHRYWLLGLTWLLLVPTYASASSLQALSLPELVARSERIVWGRVSRVDSFWQEGRIVSRAHLQVNKFLKTNHFTNTLLVDTLGGIVGTIGQRVDGAAHFAAEDEVVVHLLSHGEAMAVVGMAQGVWHIVRQPDQPYARVYRHLPPWFLPAHDSGGYGPNTLPNPERLESLLAMIAQLVGS